MIDTDKYEGHAEEEWCRESNDLYFHRDGKDIQIADILIRGDGDERYHEDVANAKLIADAPLLLAEVKRLRNVIRNVADFPKRCPPALKLKGVIDAMACMLWDAIE